jgi:hypothetical protein
MPPCPIRGVYKRGETPLYLKGRRVGIDKKRVGCFIAYVEATTLIGYNQLKSSTGEIFA